MSTARLVLLHGWTMDGSAMSPLARALGEGQCLTPTLPGHGSAQNWPPTIEGAVDQLAALIASHGLSDITLVGWSLGAMIGWQYLAQGGAGIARMVSLDMSPRPLPEPGWTFGMRGQSQDKARLIARRARADWPAIARAIAPGLFARAEGCAEMSTQQAQARIEARDGAIMAEFWESLTRADLRSAIARIEVPLLAIHGAQSRVYPPATADWIARTAQQGQALILPDCGHAPNLENPRATAAAIEAFVRQTTPHAPGA